MTLMTTVAVSAATALSTNAFKNAQGPAQALDDLMEIIGFGKLNSYAEKKRALRKLDVQQYIEDITSEMKNIEPENFQEPKISIVGPALEASKYYIEDDMLRSMFAKLVSSSIDSSKNGIVHESFVEIIKQLSSLDAKHLVQISKKRANPIINIDMKYKDVSGRKTAFESLYESQYIELISLDNQNIIASSISNLERLGLIKVSMEQMYFTPEIYHSLINTDFVQSILNSPPTKDKESDYTFEIKKGVIDLTPLGNNFCQICL